MVLNDFHSHERAMAYKSNSLKRTIKCFPICVPNSIIQNGSKVVMNVPLYNFVNRCELPQTTDLFSCFCSVGNEHFSSRNNNNNKCSTVLELI